MSEKVIEVDFRSNRGLKKVIKGLKDLFNKNKREKNKKLRKEKKRKREIQKAYMKRGS
ncbi:MAG: hypothetical protein RSB70_04305 [Clostridium sp.]